MTDARAAAAGPSPRYRILLVEDDLDLRMTVADVLETEGYEVSTAQNGADALAQLRGDAPLPDVIVLDLMMPVMDGWSFRAEQRRDARLASIPVLVLSASDPPASAALGVADHVRKPCSADAVLRGVSRIVHGLEHGRIQMQRHAQAERLASLGLLAAGVAHEINNPLAYVTANLQFVRDQLARAGHGDGRAAGGDDGGDGNDGLAAPLPLDEVRAAVDEALEGARRISAIVADIRAVSTADDARRDAIDPVRVLESALNIAGGEIRRRARLVRRFGPAPRVDANDGRLTQVFVNLLINAAQAIPENDASERHEIRVETSTGPRGEAVVEVRDTGPGIPPEVLPHVFEPFFTTKPAGIGTGLGLSICRGIVAALGGEITLESELGRGTTVRVVLPPSRAASGVRAATTAATAASPARAPRVRLLAVDDERGILRALERLLGADHEVATAASGREALELLRRGGAFDVILCDLLMPEMTGMELHAALARERPELAARMVFMTGSAASDQARDHVQALAGRTVAKPLDRAALERAIHTALGERDAKPT